MTFVLIQREGFATETLPALNLDRRTPDISKLAVVLVFVQDRLVPPIGLISFYADSYPGAQAVLSLVYSWR